MSKVKVIYTCKAEWEHDWLKDVLFADIEFDFINDPDMTTVEPNSIIVYNETNEGKLMDYINKYTAKGYRFALIHLSDEAYQGPNRIYANAQFVYRNYYTSKFDKVGTPVECFPLGWKTGFPRTEPKSITNRKYTWNFIGQVEFKPTRQDMLKVLNEIPKGYVHETKQWDDPNGLGIEEYHAILNESIYTACPMGWCNPDSFRLCEALEAGSIPIVDNPEYFDKFFGEYPFPAIKSWYQLPDIRDRKKIKSLQKKCIEWWADYKVKMAAKFKQYVDKLIDTESELVRVNLSNKSLEDFIAVSDVTKLSENSVDEIRADGVLCEIEDKDLVVNLQAWAKALKPGGKLLVCDIPNFAMLTKCYTSEALNEEGKPYDIY